MAAKEKLRKNERRPKGKPFILIDRSTDNHADIRIRPDGFWSDAITVSQWTDVEDDRGSFWEEVAIDWGCGGRGGDFPTDNIQAAKNFAEAMKQAVAIAERWHKRAGQYVKAGDV